MLNINLNNTTVAISGQWFKALDAEGNLVFGVKVGEPALSGTTVKLPAEEQVVKMMNAVGSNPQFSYQSRISNGHTTIQCVHTQSNKVYYSLNYFDPLEPDIGALPAKVESVQLSSKEELGLLRNGLGTTTDTGSSPFVI